MFIYGSNLLFRAIFPSFTNRNNNDNNGDL